MTIRVMNTDAKTSRGSMLFGFVTTLMQRGSMQQSLGHRTHNERYRDTSGLHGPCLTGRWGDEPKFTYSGSFLTSPINVYVIPN